MQMKSLMGNNRKAIYKIIFVSLIAVIGSTSSCVAQKTGPALWNMENLPAEKQIISKANAIASRQPVSVVHKVTLTGDAHNYESLAYYAWRNSDGTYTVRDGHPSPDYQKYDANKIYKLDDGLTALARGYYVTKDEKYAKAAVKQLEIWFIDDSTRMNPNFNYCQVVPGANGNNGNPGGINEAYCFLDVLDCIAVLENDGQIGKKDLRRLRRWFSDFGEWLNNSKVGQKMDGTKNNLAIMYDVVRYRIAMFTGDKATKSAIRDNFYARRLSTQVAEDGRQPEELKRNRSMMYSMYNLNHIFQLLHLIRQDGGDVSAYHPRVKAALDFISRYINDKAAYPYQDIGDWASYSKDWNELVRLYQVVFAEKYTM